MASRLGTLISFALAHAVNAAVSASTPLPPLQWISLSSLTSGSSPPPLKDASIGYNAVSRTLLIFGGESESGVAQSATYLLNLDTLTWAQPTPPAGIGSTPPARSAAVSGDDFAASYRTGHLVVGGKGTNGAFLTDIWEFDYNNQFWAQVNVGSGGPSVIIPGGGIDNINVFFEMNDSLPTNSFYAFGGSSSPVSLSDAWELQIAGALAPNIQQGLTATWISRKFSGSRPAMAGQGGTVNHRKLISFGGCVGTANPNISCVTGNATIVDIASGSVVTVPPCAAPRLGPAVVSNRSPFTSSFETQAFAFLGTFNTSLWNDGGGLQRGEVDILDFAAATWTRVLPADDPSGGVPSPREGAAALSFNEGLVGTSRAGYSDTIVFGGKNASGTYFNDLWILRAYNGSVSSSGARWSGYGNGNLQSGINANGQGVTMQFLSSCATAIASAPTAPGSSTAPFPTATDPSTSPSSAPVLTSGVHPYDTATSHKVLAPISVALFPLGIIFLRLSQPTAHSTAVGDRSLGLRTLSRAIFAVAFGSGLAGLILSFTTIVASPSSTSKIAKRAVSSDNILRTTHGQAGIALFVLLYVVLPILAIGYSVVRRVHKRLSGEDAADDAMLKNGERAESVDAVEKLNGGSSGAASPNPHPYDRSAVTTPAIEAPIPASPRRRHRSLTSSSFITSLLPTAERRSNESIALSEPTAPSGPPSTNPHSFEVVNRPPRRRHLSATEGPMSDSSHRTFTGQPRRSLSDISWLDRRRSVNAVNEIDYALMQLHQRGPATPATELSSNALMKPGERPADIRLPTMPPAAHTLFSFLANLLILALSVHSLVALWERAPRAAFVVFLIWIVVLYVAIVVLAWYGRPRHSALAVVLSRLRGDHTHTQPYDAAAVTPNESRPMSPAGPYLHQPLFRAAATEEEYGSATRMANGARAAEDEVDSDEDEDTRQRRIEDEMQRRDVSIVTVPKRRLWITNPS